MSLFASPCRCPWSAYRSELDDFHRLFFASYCDADVGFERRCVVLVVLAFLGILASCAGNAYAGEWADGRRNGLGRETHGRWIYHGEWTAGIKGRYGVRHSAVSGARYEGTWVSSLQDGFGVETYSDNSEFFYRCVLRLSVSV